MSSGYDLLAIGAHPDDADLGVGGMLANAARQGLRVAMLDLTRGELGTRGTSEERGLEAAAAARVLGVDTRVNAGLPDGALADTPEQRLVVIQKIRELRPKVILAPMRHDRHPDHEAAHALARATNFMAGLPKVETGQAPHRAGHIYFYHAYFNSPEPPSMVLDVSEVFELKLSALREFRSQFHNPDRNEPETAISTAAFWEQIATRAAFWGNQVGVRHGEPLYSLGPLGMALPPGFF